MPLRMMLANPIALAALAVIAIGVISYNIIKSKKRKIPVLERRIEYVANYEFEYKPRDHPEVRKRYNANTENMKSNSENAELKDESSSYTNRKFPDVSPGSSIEKEGLCNNLDSLNQNRNEISEVQNINQNIYEEDFHKVDITKIVTDEDAESSVSNVSSHSSNNLTEEPISLDSQEFKGSSQKNNSEKLYKKEVCERLKNDVETMSISSADSNLSENDDENDMYDLRDLDNVVEKPIICKGCEESYANAVAYPCGHRYLCLDCAIKVHRIYKKCTVCNLYIETYDIYSQE